MKTVLKKAWYVLHDVIKFMISIVMLAFLAAVFVLGLALVPITAIAMSISQGGTLFDNTSDSFNILMDCIFENWD